MTGVMRVDTDEEAEPTSARTDDGEEAEPPKAVVPSEMVRVAPAAPVAPTAPTDEPSKERAPPLVTSSMAHGPGVQWCPCHGGDPFAGGGTGFRFMSLSRATACPVAGAPPLPPPRPLPPTQPPQKGVMDAGRRTPTDQGDSDSSGRSDSASADTKELAVAVEVDDEVGRTSSTLEAQGSWDAPGGAAVPGQAGWQRTFAVAVRVCAWMLHAMVDGMVLASAPSNYVLLATALPVTVCALQDSAAFTVTMARLGHDSPRSLTLAVAALSCAFPLGAMLSRAVLESASSQVAVLITRTIVAGIFTYMALFELAPPHTHSRAANGCYVLCFCCGALMACLVDAVEQLTAEGHLEVVVNATLLGA